MWSQDRIKCTQKRAGGPADKGRLRKIKHISKAKSWLNEEKGGEKNEVKQDVSRAVALKEWFLNSSININWDLAGNANPQDVPSQNSGVGLKQSLF